jgi:hypothetical protein
MVVALLVLGRASRAGVTQLVECDLAKVDVAGSNPVSRSNPFWQAVPAPGTEFRNRTLQPRGKIPIAA